MRELLPAYVLGALEPDEVREVETHLRSGREHDDELVELRATLLALDRYADESSVQTQRSPERRPAFSIGRVFGGGLFGQAAALPARRVAATAAVAFALFAAGWFFGGVGQGGTQHDVSFALHGSSGQSVSLRGETSQERVNMTMSGFDRLTDGRVYQLWAIRDGVWEQIGLCNPDEQGHWSGDFPFAIRRDDGIALTIEPAGGSSSPTSDPLLIAQS
jgi:anti-sigma-K factor RskA